MSSSWLPGGGTGGADGGGGRGASPGATAATRRTWQRAGLVAAAVVTLAAVAAAGIGVGRLTSGHGSQLTASQPIPKPASTRGAPLPDKLDIAKIAAEVDPAVVDINSVLSCGGGAAGTGMVLTPNGEVLTNNHVVEGATSISAQVDGKGPTYAVKVLGTDPTQDVALVQIVGASGLPTVVPGNSATLAVGQQVVAIGNALALPGAPTVTSGIVSALSRSISASADTCASTEHLSGMVQTNAAINPGNSGGPLVNAAGQVIAMNTAAANGTDNATNIGFAIPIDEALAIASQIQQGRPSALVQIGVKGYIGVEVESVAAAEAGGGNPFEGLFPGAGGSYTPPVRTGAVVIQVVNGSAAAGAGIVAGDVITALNGRTVSSPSSLTGLLAGDHPGRKVTLTWVDTSGAAHMKSLTLGSGPVP